ncbi:MAG: deoxyribodipyrimidine photo-lyase [bacterium]
MNEKRVTIIKKGEKKAGPIVYWMSRDQRVRDNWALLYAQERAVKKKEPLIVTFVLVPQFLEATIRHYGFMIRGLQEVEKDLSEKNIPFFLIMGTPHEKIPEFIKTYHVSALITDFDPLRIKREWQKGVLEKIDIPCYEVDAHNIVPCRVASDKQEYAAYTFRPKVHRNLPEFLDDLPSLEKHPILWREKPERIDYEMVKSSLQIDKSVIEVDWLKPGERSAHHLLQDFIASRLAAYDEKRNDPTQNGQSHLSPYLHFGQISAQRVALEIQESSAPGKAKDAFLEELIVRRELSDNFCFYCPHYDRFEGFPDWARESLTEHLKDPREHLYDMEHFEEAKTRDPLWNAAQMEMVKRGKMHGYMRMYWAKKILEWTGTPQEALEIALYLNNKYELDGRDPNGYTGVSWSIGGVHDRAWPERPVFGKIRFMSYRGYKSKFNINEYIKKVSC